MHKRQQMLVLRADIRLMDRPRKVQVFNGKKDEREREMLRDLRFVCQVRTNLIAQFWLASLDLRLKLHSCIFDRPRSVHNNNSEFRTADP